MKINERAQEQLELLWILSEETSNEPAASPGQLEDYRELVEAGLVILDGERVRLSATGKHEAAMAIRRHRLAERLFVDVLATDDSLIDEKACTLEHALFDGVDETICTLLGHPVVCPHGNPIPPGRCCE